MDCLAKWRQAFAGKGKRFQRGFVLLEVMLGVAIFSVGVLALGHCVNQCVQARVAQNEDQIARLALSNRLAEIQGLAIDPAKDRTDELKGMFKGITLKQRAKPLQLVDENKKIIDGILQLEIEAVWKSGREEQSKVLTLYAHRLQIR